MRDHTVENGISRESGREVKWIFPQHSHLQRFEFGAVGEPGAAFPSGAVEVPSGQKLLHGAGYEFIVPGGRGAFRQSGELSVWESADLVTGFVRTPVASNHLEEAAHRLYREILSLAERYQFCRFWNYVPDINHVAEGRIENYKLFCSGRAGAFAEVLGADSAPHFPSASATGSGDGHLTVIFLGSRNPVRNWENPEQTPAYRYPKAYGPRPPSFARASQFEDHDGREWVFISGTAAIKGHETQCVGDFEGQLAVTLDNLDLTLRQAGLRLDPLSPERSRCFKVFLRDAGHLEGLLARMSPILGKSDTLTVVEADICRRQLEVEIEMAVVPENLSGD